MKDEVEKLRQQIIGSLSRAQAYGVSEQGELVIEAEANRLLTLFQKAQVEAVRAEIEDIIDTINTFQEHSQTPNQTLKVVNKELLDRLASLTKEDGANNVS